MKLQSIALGLALAVAGSAFAGTVTQERTVTRVTPHGTVTRHVVKTQHVANHRAPVRHVVVREVHRQPHHRHVNRVVIVHPTHHGHVATNRTVVIHRHG